MQKNLTFGLTIPSTNPQTDNCIPEKYNCPLSIVPLSVGRTYALRIRPRQPGPLPAWLAYPNRKRLVLKPPRRGAVSKYHLELCRFCRPLLVIHSGRYHPRLVTRHERHQLLGVILSGNEGRCLSGKVFAGLERNLFKSLNME